MSGIDDVIALSPLQEGLFSLARLATERDGPGGDDAEGDVYTIPLIVDITGPLDRAALRTACENILIRHPNLRAVFWDKDVPKPVQIVPTEVSMPWADHELSEEAADAFTEREVRRVFDLRDGPSLRFTLIRITDVPAPRHRLIVTVHHILMDGWSVGVFFAELLQMYRAGGSADALGPVRPYRDYIAWLNAQDQAAMIARWSAVLGQLSGPLMFAEVASTGLDATDTRTPVASHYTVDAERTARLIDWSRAQGITLNTAVQFAWTLVLSRLVDRRDVVYGTVVTGRPHQVTDADRMIGLFLNTIPVAFTLDPDADVAAECRRLQRESADLRDIGYLSLSAVQRAAGHSALFDTMFVFQNAPMDQAGDTTTPDGVTFAPAMAQNLTHYPLTVVAYLHGDELLVAVEAIEGVLPVDSDALAALLLDTLDRLPVSGERSVGDVDIVGPERRRALIAESTTSPTPGTGTEDIVELFVRQVDSTPGAIALTDGRTRLTYRELLDDALSLADVLRSAGVGPEDFVAICLPRGVDSIVSILASLAAGGAYVPVDITLPAERISSILTQVRPAAIIIDTSTDPGQAAPQPDAAPIVDLGDPSIRDHARGPMTGLPARRRPAQAAYAIFTSGSTGEPKGVVNSDAALASYFADHRERVYWPARARLGRPLRIAHAWSLSFDASWQPMIGLFDGHTIHLFDDDAMRDTDLLVTGIRDQRIDMIDTTPSMFRQLAHAGLVDGYAMSTAGTDDAPLSVLALGGEAIDDALWDRLRSLAGVAVHNCYGPTETTVEAVVADVTGADASSPTATIGRPTAAMSGYVLDSGLRQVPDGVTGELYLAGPQVTRGYLGRFSQTAERFVADPFGPPGRRMYRTGDLVRRRPGGALHYLGRADDQVKVRGYRVEIGEIEKALRGAAGVRDAAAVVVRRPVGAVLVGFVVPVADGSADPIAIRTGLADRLPSYMIPARLLVVAELPVTVNGKLDSHALTNLARTALESRSDTAEPETETQRVLADALAEVFGGVSPGIDDDFFDLGLDSIVAIALAAAARARGLGVSVRMIASSPTIRDLAAAIDAGGDETEEADGTDDLGEITPLPYPAWMFRQESHRRLSHTVLLCAPADLTVDVLETIIQTLLDTHPVLRSSVIDTERGPRQVIGARGTVAASGIVREVPAGDIAEVRRRVLSAVDEIDPRTGDVMRVRLLRGVPGGDLVAITIHHLAIDVVSWSLVIPELAQRYQQVCSGGDISVGRPVGTSYRRWCAVLDEYARSPELAAQEAFWTAQLDDAATATEKTGPLRWGDVRTTEAGSTPAETAALLAAAGPGGIRELLLTALTLTLAAWRRQQGVHGGGVTVALESHGRGGIEALDVSGTVGWFTTVYPVRLGDLTGVAQVDATDGAEVRALHDSVCAALAAVPGDGLGYGLLRDIAGVESLRSAPEPPVEFNYLGRFDLGLGTGGNWSPVTDPELSNAIPSSPEPDLTLRFPLNLVTAVQAGDDGPQLVTTWRWSSVLFDAEQIDDLARLWRTHVSAVASAFEKNKP